jgi:hypothetical protein
MSTLLDHLQAIRDEHGTLTPALVVEAAANPDHPLHNRFEWDDTAAAQQWRLTQASSLLRVVKMPASESGPRDLRAFVAVKGADTHRADYVPTGEALADTFTRQLVLRDMEREWKTLRRRYAHMSEFAALIQRDMNGETA